MVRRKKEVQFTRENARLFYGKRQLQYLIALRELRQLIDIAGTEFPILAEEMRAVTLEVERLVPSTEKARSAAKGAYPGHEARRRQRYEKRKARLQEMEPDPMHRRSLYKLEKGYNSPLLQRLDRGDD